VPDMSLFASGSADERNSSGGDICLLEMLDNAITIMGRGHWSGSEDSYWATPARYARSECPTWTAALMTRLNVLCHLQASTVEGAKKQRLLDARETKVADSLKEE
jgi:hypothetical protein